MPLIETSQGMIERERLTVHDIVEEGDNHRSIATEWRLDGVLVRRDAHVMILRTVAMSGEQVRM
jgi:hypothetical protein